MYIATVKVFILGKGGGGGSEILVHSLTTTLLVSPSEQLQRSSVLLLLKPAKCKSIARDLPPPTRLAEVVVSIGGGLSARRDTLVARLRDSPRSFCSHGTYEL